MSDKIEGSQAPTANAQPTEQPQADPKKKRGPWSVVFVVSLIVFIVAVIALGVIAFSYWQGQQKYGQIAETSGIEVADIENDYRGVKVDWDALLAVNPDTVAWLYVPNTNINYPVVQGKDNEHYLTYDFDGSAGWLAEYGTVFMDYRNKPDWSDQAYFIYGHHMNDGSMFADIAKMTDQARFDGAREAYLLTPKGNFHLRSYSLIHCAADDPIVEMTFESAEKMTAYVQDKINRSVVSTGQIPAADKITKTFAFSTCDADSSGRYVLFCYVVDTSTAGLEGVVGLQVEDGANAGFANDLAPTR